jgi:hypothetical protein
LLGEYIKDFIDLKIRIDELSELKEQTKEKIRHSMKDLGLDKYVDTVGNVVTIKESIRNSVNTSVIKEMFLAEGKEVPMKATVFSSVTVLSKEEIIRRKNFLGGNKNED